MGRSKFPGKPAKHVNRKRINVLPPPISLNAVVGYNNTTVTSQTDEETTKQVSSKNENDPNEASASNPPAAPETRVQRRIPTRKDTSKAIVNRAATKKNLVAGRTIKNVKKVPVRKSVRAYPTGRTLPPQRKQPLTPKKETSNLVGKFVLPTRSVHSSRVIKPNKRFINVELSDPRIVKKRVVCKRHENEDKPKKTKCPEESCSKPNEPAVQTPCSNNNNNNNNNGRIVLRQARLQLHTQTPSGPEGPFSSGGSTTASPPGTVTCGVCGAVRFYRFVKQARKFKIYSCESCRKFISKMIKRQSCGKNANASTLVCHKGQGMCHVPPIVRSQQWKLIRCAYKARCPACWLKMCLRSFHMPVTLKNSLAQLLPKNMQGPELMFSNSLPMLSWQAEKTENTDQQRCTRLKSSVKVTEKAPPTTEVKRQKIDLKGPRVKHVCRSASIVLGQPLAVFPDKVDSKSGESKTTDSSRSDTPLEPMSSDDSTETFSQDDRETLKPPTSRSDSRRNQKQNTSSNSSFEYKPKKAAITETSNTVSIDFWESYDPDEVCRSGFGLMASEPFPMSAICYLCGSAGQEELMHCCLCCEPYHLFCLEQCPPYPTTSTLKFNWLCPRCTTCSGCNEADRTKINCQKCHKVYHPECFNNKWTGSEKPSICFHCLQCRSCGTDNITKFVGNLPLCVMCFKLRKKGNYCPLCQRCYDDNDFETMMMECAKCNKWIHSKCEGLSDEQYQILSMLPESVEFLCRLCSRDTTPYWKKALKAELKSCFSNILRLLSKNNVARNILKWSPMNNNSPKRRAIYSARKLEFSEDNETKDVEIDAAPENTLKDISLSPCTDDEVNSKLHPSMIDIKNKLNSNEYSSVTDFNQDIVQALSSTHSEQILDIYYTVLQQIFPWYNPKQVRTDATKQALCQCDNTEAEISVCLNSNNFSNVSSDTRTCSLCKGVGDGAEHLESRLLYCGQNEWVHANCALWSSEVYEEIDGSLQNVHSALIRGRSIKCAYCKQKGASVGCCLKGCYETYHFNCARVAKCSFMHDKTVYCATHDISSDSHMIVNSSEFEIRRAIYVELDCKKRKIVEIDKIHFMVGSLTVTRLGKIVPAVSDQENTIVPTGFVCSRLYWSTIEPWKLVSYVVTTSVLSSQTNTVFVDRNFTVDHSLPKAVVDKKLKDILLWQKDLCKNKSDLIDYEDEEEPQNAGDLLSPELADAILEELPYDLLDGISVQDIFPKLNYEELLNMDFKSDIGNNDNTDFLKKVPEINDDDSNSSVTNNSRELKRTKSELFPQLNNVEKLTKARNQQRACSLTLSCKLDSSLQPAIKKRKTRDSVFFQVVQVDGAYDSSSGSECGSPTHETEDGWEPKEEPVTCERCQCTYRTQASYKRHLETCEVISTSESDSEFVQEQQEPSDYDNQAVVLNIAESQEPYVVTSYESFSTFQTTQNELHAGASVVNTQTYVSSESTTSEVVSVPDNGNVLYPIQQQVVDQKLTQAIPQQSELALTAATDNKQKFCINQPPVNNPNYCVNTIPVCVPTAETAPIAVSQTIPINHAVDVQQPHQQIMQPVPFPQNQIAIDPSHGVITPAVVNSVCTQAINIPQNQWMKPVVKRAIVKTVKAKSKPRSLAAKRRQPGNGAVLIPQTNPTTPSVILQHLPSPGVVPTFMDAFHPQTGQNLQYVATIAPQINSTIAQQSPIIQLQPDGSFISLVPSVQPTMLIQQPRVVTDQLILDSNGTLTWATQPIYYGFETIVQNTVMQSQQFLPTTMPGVLTANSSYSTTTQVFQTSKLEPVLDVSSNSFVLVNSGQLVNPQVQMQQPAPITQPVPPTTSAVQTVAHAPVLKAKEMNVTKIIYQSPKKSVPVSTASLPVAPVAPFVSDQGIPTIVVTPTPKLPTATQIRPMSRVLPMQTNSPVKTVKKTIVVNTKLPVEEKDLTHHVDNMNKLVDAVENTDKQIVIEDAKKEELMSDKIESDTKVESSPFKLIFQKQTQEGIYKIGNSFVSKNQLPLQVVPLKPIKSKIQQIQNSSNNITTSSNNETADVTSSPTIPLVTPDKPEANKTLIPETKAVPEKPEPVPTPAILYTIETQDGFRYSSTSISDLWTKVFDAVQAARLAHNMDPLPVNAFGMINNLQLLGLKTNGLKYLIEQLPGMGKCVKYKPSFFFASAQSDGEDDFLLGHSSGAIRCAAYSGRSEPNDMFGWLASKHRKPESNLIDTELFPRRGSVTNLPMAMRFRQLKLTSKISVGVYRSSIHRRGLFCLRDIEAGEMVIEYAGEVIRSVLTDKREKYYNSKGIGCYMFRIDDNLVVDATMKGNAARFINHSCEPNCYSKVVEILGHKHIIIFALRRILCGEELTYDYKFPFEEDKIPCTCNSRRCRKFLN